MIYLVARNVANLAIATRAEVRRLKPVADRGATVPTELVPASVMAVHGSEFSPEDAVADGSIE